MQTKHCEICGKEPLILVGPDSRLQQCGRCGSVQMEKRLTTQVYDANYIAERYDRYPTTEQMSRLRLKIMEAVLRLFDPNLLNSEIFPEKTCSYRLLDVGYGNGSFIRHATHMGWNAFGHDVNPTPYDGVRRVALPIEPLPENERYQAITFFDCLEHFETLEEVRQISRNTDWIFISIPNPPYVWWLNPEQWKHYRAGEHHFYPDPRSLCDLFSTRGVLVEMVWWGHPEDIIRGVLPCGSPNIATVALRCTRDD